MDKAINGFSKLDKEAKINWLITNYFQGNPQIAPLLKQYWNADDKLQKLHDEFIENTITNFYLPLGIAPNFLINDEVYAIPMVIEESSVVAAASNAAKFWMSRGGFNTTIIATKKIGQVHFLYKGDFEKLKAYFENIYQKFFSETESITKNMRARGGGILSIELINRTDAMPHYYQLHAQFETCDSMGANFINSCLESFAQILKTNASEFPDFSDDEKNIEIIMAILSNYVPECLVRAEVKCKVDDLKANDISDPKKFAEKFVQAVNIAELETYRAVTHNKGIMNGVDAVVLATGNDFRAIEAGVHAYAAKSGKYTSLSHAEIKDDMFHFWIELPLALGTVGGLTSLHPMVKMALQLLGKPSARKLMEIIAVAGLAQNFAAVKSLTTTGIQQGHMRMHLMNMLNQLEANTQEKTLVEAYFSDKTVSHSAVVDFLQQLRKK